MNTRIFGAERFANLIIYSVGGHNGPIVGAFFEHNSLDVSLPQEDNVKVNFFFTCSSFLYY